MTDSRAEDIARHMQYAAVDVSADAHFPWLEAQQRCRCVRAKHKHSSTAESLAALAPCTLSPTKQSTCTYHVARNA